jgi:hypothetical protein
MVVWKARGQKWSWWISVHIPNLHLEGLRKPRKTSRQLVSRPRFEPDTSRQSRRRCAEFAANRGWLFLVVPTD